MKKFKVIVSCLVLSSMLLSVGCGAKLTTRDAARKLLSNERLNAGFLSDGGIFDRGTKAMNELADKAVANLSLPQVSEDDTGVIATSSVISTAKVLTADKGRVEIDGDTFRFMDFEEDNNSYSYFEGLTKNIVFNAERAAKLIDDVKRNVRVVDKWVKMALGDELYLHVDYNSETLLRRTDYGYDVCTRFKNSDGKDVYELYTSQDGSSRRMTYIPDERYEMSSVVEYDGERSEDFFVADNSKGYWETYVLGVAPEHYNVSYFVMKNNICYDAFYDPQTADILLLKVMSADRATDILQIGQSYSGLSLSLKFSGFDGIKYVEVPSSGVEYYEDANKSIANVTGWESAVIHTKNGKTLKFGDTYGKLTVNGSVIGYGSGIYTGEMAIEIDEDDLDECYSILKSFLAEYGLTCRRNIDGVLGGIMRSYVDVEGIISYYRWNGVVVTDEAAIASAVRIEYTRFDAMKAIYEDAKNAEVVNILDTVQFSNNMSFPEIKSVDFSGMSVSENRILISSASLSIDDCTLIVAEDDYKVGFALAGDDGLVHLNCRSEGMAKYSGNGRFSLTTRDIELELADLPSGSYTLVAYIATYDDIRSSKYVKVSGFATADVPKSIHIGAREVGVSLADGSLVVNYEENGDGYATITSDKPLSAEELTALIATEAFVYGIPKDGFAEYLNEGSYVTLKGEETDLPSGIYRLGYTTQSGESVDEGYIYVLYTCGN